MRDDDGLIRAILIMFLVPVLMYCSAKCIEHERKANNPPSVGVCTIGEDRRFENALCTLPAIPY